MKKQRLALAAALLGAAVLTTSCDSFLDIKPVTKKPDIGSYDTADKVDATLLAAYNRLQSGDMYGGQIQVLGELFGDNIDFSEITGTTGDGAFRARQYGIFDGVGAGTWSAAYTAIFRSNLAIEAVEQNKFTADAAVINRLKGEGLFIRAISHFELLRLFAKPYSNNPATDPGVPLRVRVLSSNEAANDRVPRTPVGEVYARVIADLQQAATLLPPTNPGRATSWAAKAYLTRVYFEQNDFANAERTASDVITSGGFTLGMPPAVSVTGPFQQSGQNSIYSSVIFQLVNYAGSDQAGGLRRAFFNTGGSAFVGRPLNATGSDNVFNALRAEGGARFTALVRQDSTAVIDPLNSNYLRAQSLKYTGQDSTTALPANVPVLRLQEVLLSRAESRAELGTNDAGALADLNAVRAAAGRPASAAAGKTALLAAIRLERRVELVFEGDRFQQLRRLKLPSRGFAFNSGRLLLIPLDEVNGNTAIEQNGGD